MAAPKKNKQKEQKEQKEQMEEVVKDRKEGESISLLTPKTLIPTGSTLLNLALADNPFGGFTTGSMANLIGDSSSGKSFLALTMLAMMANDPKFDNYRLIYDDVEAALAFDMEYLFGKKAQNRIEVGFKSKTIQDFRRHVFSLNKADKPYAYVLDSFDALSSEEEVERSNKDDGSGSYKTEKPKLASELFRQGMQKIEELNAFIMVISQTRDNLGFGAMFKPKVRSGGHALKFYATHELWLSMEKPEKKKELVIGTNVCAKVSKNKITGKKRDAYFPVFYDMGVDDITSCVNYLVDKKVWGKEKQTIKTDFNFEGTMAKVVEHIENNNLEKELSDLVGKTWNEIEDSVKLNRKKRFE